MIKRIGHYRLAIYLTVALALVHLVFLFYLRSLGFRGADSALMFLVPAVAVAFGLWVASNLARYAGGIIFLITCGIAIWPLFTPSNVVFGPARSGSSRRRC